jgi:3,4-dihydroxy 2-butanone 4-phosphate synthase/GTP cyclohydrolase II
MNESRIGLGPALDALAAGKPVLIADDASRVFRGVLAQAAWAVTADDINDSARIARGVTCVAITPERAHELGLDDKLLSGNEHAGVFTRSVEARHGVSTGISAGDRAITVRLLGQPGATAADIVSPGHVFPVVVHAAGVLGRVSEAEAAVDLLRLAGGYPVAAFMHVLGVDGNLAGSVELEALSAATEIPLVRVSQLVSHRMEREFFVHEVGMSVLETAFGPFEARIFENELDGASHVCLTRGDLASVASPLVRIHSQCLTGDVFHSLRCDCGDQLASAMERMAQEPAAALVYLRQEGRGIGLVNKIRAYALQDRGKDTVDANLELGFAPDQRSFVVAAQILKKLGVRAARLVTNNPHKVAELEQYGVVVTERIPSRTEVRPENEHYLEVKVRKLGHLIEM